MNLYADHRTRGHGLEKDRGWRQAEGPHCRAQPGIYQQIIVQSNQFNLGVDLIVAGIDGTGSHVYYVGHPGTMVSFDKIGYNAVGSGASHVAIKFALDCLHPNTLLGDVLLAVYAAKRAAEVAPGVGQETEIKVISSSDIWSVPTALMDVLKDVHNEGAKKSKPSADKIKAKYDELRKNA
jgi:20S proteasome alpha/beta subunit